MKNWILIAALATLVGCGIGTEPGAPEEVLPSLVVPKTSADTVTGELRESREFWQARLKKDPYDFIACRKLASAHIALARHTGDEKHFTAAEDALQESIRLHPIRNPGARGKLAMVQMAFHRFREARATVDEALKETPDETWLLAVRGDAWFGMGKYEEARDDYEAYHKAKPGFSSVTRLAAVRYVFGECDEALGLYRQGVEDSRGTGANNEAWAHLMVGVQFLRREDYRTARDHFGDSLQRAPDYFLAMEHIAETLEAEGRDADARPYLEAAIAIKREPELLVRLADMDERAGKEATTLHDEALEILEARVAEGGVGHLRSLAEMLMDRAEDLPRALTLAKQDLEVRRDLGACRVMARALRLNGKAKEAVPYVKEMLRYKTPEIELWEEAAAVFEAAGMTAELARLQGESPFAHAA